MEMIENKNTVIRVLDPKGAGGAHHEYEVVTREKVRGPYQSEAAYPVVGKVTFQNGPIQENGVNGLQQEDLLLIVIDRLKDFQKGDFRCRENALALTKIEEALMWLRARTEKRVNMGIEGKNVNHE